MNPFKAEFEILTKKLKNDLESASLVEHAGLKGARIEQVLAAFLSEIVPKKFQISTNQIVVDCEGRQSRECDVVISNKIDSFTILQRFIPIETVYGVIEVKKHLDAKSARDFRKKVDVFRKLNYRGLFANDVEHRLKEVGFCSIAPSFNLFSITSDFSSIERYCAQTYTDPFGNDGWSNNIDKKKSPNYCDSLCCSMDIGISRNTSINGNSFLALDISEKSQITKSAKGEDYHISEATALLMFLTFLEPVLAMRNLVLPFDNRSYSMFHDEVSSGIEPDMTEFSKILSELNV